MSAFLYVLDGYVMVFMIYFICNGLLYCTLWDRLGISWRALLLLTVVETVAIYQVLHYIWVGNVLVLFLFALLFLRFTDVEAYKLLYLILITVTYTTAINLMYYMIWGSSYAWYWGEMRWMLLAYVVSTPFVWLGMSKLLWPKLAKLDLPASRWLWIVPAFAIMVTMLVGSSHVQFLMMGYENVYGLTALLVVILSAGVSLLTLAIMQKNQLAVCQKHDMELVEVQITAQSNRHVEVMQQMDEIRIMRHDLRHHIRIVNSLVDKGDMERLRSFVGEMERDQRLYDNIVYSQNHVCDLVSHHAMLIATETNIRLSIRCGLPRSFWVSETDLCVLLGNLLENALNACQLQSSGTREIIMTCKVQAAEAYIVLENTYDEKMADSNARRDKAGLSRSSGYGIPSIRNIADKYCGMATFKRNSGKYISSILLSKPESTDMAELTASRYNNRAQ